MSTVGIIVAGVTTQLRCTRGGCKVLEFPFVSRAALLDVVHVLQPLQMLVGLAVKLEVGFEIRFVGTQLADKVAGDEGKNLAFARPRPVGSEMMTQGFEGVRGETVAYATVIKMGRIGISGFGWRLHAVW